MDKIIKENFDCIDIANFWMNVKKGEIHNAFTRHKGACWEWQGTLFTSGYGHFNCHRKSFRAHRVAYYLYNGKISKDLFICHKCDNPRCVNPKHMFEGTAKENIKDRDKKGHYRARSKTKNKNKFFGVFKRENSEKWRVKIGINYKTIQFGTFSTEIEAAKAYDDKIKELDVDRPLNFPDG